MWFSEHWIIIANLGYLYKILGLQIVEILEKIQKREKKYGVAGDRTEDIRKTLELR